MIGSGPQSRLQLVLHNAGLRGASKLCNGTSHSRARRHSAGCYLDELSKCSSDLRIVFEAVAPGACGLVPRLLQGRKLF